MREYMQRRYRARMATAIERLGGRCIQCGSTESLEFDHIDPSTKLMDISQAVTYSTRVFEAELAKCQLLCASHHQQKTLQQNGMTLARAPTARSPRPATVPRHVTPAEPPRPTT